MSQNVSELLGASMSKVREMVDANTVVGSPIHISDEVTLLPISKISFGLASGGADFTTKNAPAGSFGGGAGCGVKITPVAFIVIQGEKVRIMPISEPASTTADRIIEQLPELVDKIAAMLKSPKNDLTDI